MFKILSIFFLISLLTKKLDGQVTGSANAPMPIGGVTPPMPMINATSRVPLVDRKNSTIPPLVPMPRDENDEDSDGGPSNPESSKVEHEQEHEHNNISEHEHEGNSEHEENDTNNNEEMETTEQTTTEASENEKSSEEDKPIELGSCHQDNEIFDRCGGCEGTCTNPNPVCTEICNFNNAGCRCRDGFVRDRNGLCIRPSSCPDNNPPSCDINEDWDECGGCEATCNNPNPSCPFNCGPGACRCRDGWVRHPNGNCVDPQQCFSNQCRLNEVFNRCSTGCEGNCSNTSPSCMLDSQCCRFSRCECPVSNGFVRDNFGNCIPSSQCPSQGSPSCSNMLCSGGTVCVMRKPPNCNFCSEQPTCIQMPTCQNVLCSNGFRCTLPSCQSFPYIPICVRSD